MKTTLLLLLTVTTWLVGPVAINAQVCPDAMELSGTAKINYGLRITSVNPTVVYEAYMITNGDGCRTVGSSQFSLVVSGSTTLTIVDNNASGLFNNTWGINTTVVDNTANLKYLAVASTGSGQRITFTAGVQFPLFTFSLGNCTGGVRIFRNTAEGNAPADPASVQGGDFKNTFVLAASQSSNGPIGGREAYDINESSFRECPALILPLTLSNFSARAVSNKQVLLTWQTLNEVNTKQFTIERSSKPLASNSPDWQTIGTLAAAGTFSGNRNYQLTDNQPLDGANYYRLRTTDKDGKQMISEIRQVNFKGNGLLLSAVYPNPVERGGAVTIALAETIRYRLLDKTGRLVSAGTFAAGTAKLKAPPVAGTYLLELSGIQNDGIKEHHRVIVQ